MKFFSNFLQTGVSHMTSMENPYTIADMTSPSAITTDVTRHHRRQSTSTGQVTITGDHRRCDNHNYGKFGKFKLHSNWLCQLNVYQSIDMWSDISAYQPHHIARNYYRTCGDWSAGSNVYCDPQCRTVQLVNHFNYKLLSANFSVFLSQ